jgi:hypothetical protein
MPQWASKLVLFLSSAASRQFFALALFRPLTNVNKILICIAGCCIFVFQMQPIAIHKNHNYYAYPVVLDGKKLKSNYSYYKLKLLK